MNTLNPTSGLQSQALLDRFTHCATQAAAVQLSVQGQQFDVIALGSLQGTGGTRQVAWVQPDVDTTTMFTQALGQRYGAGMSQAISQELGLQPAPGQPLASRLVQQAMDMAQTGAQALEGVDFLTRLEHSAQHQGSAFRQLVQQSGLDPSRLSADTLTHLDRQMDASFAAATQRGESPVRPEVASRWLTAYLQNLQLS